MSSSCSPRVSLSYMDVCHRLKLQSVTALLYKLRMTAREKGLGTKLWRGLGQTKPKPNCFSLLTVFPVGMRSVQLKMDTREKLEMEEAFTAEVGKNGGNERSLRLT